MDHFIEYFAFPENDCTPSVKNIYFFGVDSHEITVDFNIIHLDFHSFALTFPDFFWKCPFGKSESKVLRILGSQKLQRWLTVRESFGEIFLVFLKLNNIGDVRFSIFSLPTLIVKILLGNWILISSSFWSFSVWNNIVPKQETTHDLTLVLESFCRNFAEAYTVPLPVSIKLRLRFPFSVWASTTFKSIVVNIWQLNLHLVFQ